MVRYSTSKTKLSQNFKNLNGIDTTLRIDKQGRSLAVAVEQKLLTCIYQNAIHVLWSGLIFLLLYLFMLNDVYVAGYITAIFVIIILYQSMSAVYEESLIVVHSLGYQVTSKNVVGQRDLFIPWNQVQSIFINEVIVRHKVVHLLTVLTKDEDGEKLIPLFLALQPRLQHLELICKHLKGANS